MFDSAGQIDRRSALVGISGLAFAAGARSQGFALPRQPGFASGLPGGVSGAGAAPDFKPYRTINAAMPSRSRWRSTVVELLDFSCPYCRQINLGAQSWGGTLPKPFRFLQLPIIHDTDSLNAAAAFMTAVIAAPQKVNALIQACFEAVQSHGESPTHPATYSHAAMAAGISKQALTSALSRFDEVRAQTRDLLDLIVAAKPEVTPTFIVDATEVVDVNNTAGDYAQMFRLLNGLVSQRVTPQRR